MEKKILVAVDDSIPSKQAVKYAARISPIVKQATFTLFNVQPVIPQSLIEEAKTDPGIRAEANRLIRLNAEAAKRILDNYKDLMCREGIAEDHIETVTQLKQLGIAKDILNQTEQGLYDAILMGRKDITRSQEFFMGTTAAKIMEYASEVPVWIVDAEATTLKIMLAADGSENSLRAVDYINYTVGENPSVTLTLYHVLPHLRHYYTIAFEKEEPSLQEALHHGDKRRIERFYEEAFKRFRKAGLRKSQIEVKTNIRAYNVSTAILDEARSGLYGTVVIGRHGEREAFFMGSVAMRLVQKVSGQALWVVP
ncbi:MAG: universal stress protein [Desulfobacterales bacterium]|nr:universal stress protein [Desulfobacterales bacterium]